MSDVECGAKLTDIQYYCSKYHNAEIAATFSMGAFILTTSAFTWMYNSTTNHFVLHRRFTTNPRD